MTEEKTFEPITTQDQLDAILRKRLKDQKDLQQEVENLKVQLEAKNEELDSTRAEHALSLELQKRGIRDEAKRARIRRLIDLGEASGVEVSSQLDALSVEVPELFKVPVGAGSGGSSKPVLEPTEKPLTEADIANMSPEEMAKPGVMQRVDRFVRGERG